MDRFRADLRALGPITFEEYVVGIIFALMALLWVFRTDIDFGGGHVLPGWSNIWGDKKARTSIHTRRAPTVEAGPHIAEGDVHVVAHEVSTGDARFTLQPGRRAR